MVEHNRLADLLVSCAMMIHTQRKHFEGKDCNEVGDWIRFQLQECAVPCMPMGMSHVYLTETQHPDYEMIPSNHRKCLNKLKELGFNEADEYGEQGAIYENGSENKYEIFGSNWLHHPSGAEGYTMQTLIKHIEESYNKC